MIAHNEYGMGLDWFLHYTGWNDFANCKRFSAPADPWKLVRVNPADVDHLTIVPITWGLGRVQGGDWDSAADLTPVTEIPAYRGFRQRFEAGRDWTDTAYYEMAVSRIERNGQFRGCSDPAEFLETNCAAVDELYERIREEGYRPNRGTVYDHPDDADTVHDLEPMVVVGRSGDVYWTEGFHRLVIAKLLDVPAVPVYVLQRHAEWQAVRDEVAGADDADRSAERRAVADHPDLEDVRA